MSSFSQKGIHLRQVSVFPERHTKRDASLRHFNTWLFFGNYTGFFVAFVRFVWL